MKSFWVFVFIGIVVLGFIFWDKISPGDSEITAPDESESVIVMEEPDLAPQDTAWMPANSEDYRALIRAQRWNEALNHLDALDAEKIPIDALDAKHLCLMQEGRFDEADRVVEEIVIRAPNSPSALRCVLRSLNQESLSPSQKRQRLSLVAGAFPDIDSETSARLVREVEQINAWMPSSIQGQVAVEKYRVVPNDCLWNICKDFRKRHGFSMESGLIRLLNGLEKDMIYPGQTLLIPKEKITLKIYRKNWLLAVFIGDCLLSAYQVGLGRMDKTPGGQFVIKTRLEHPDWYSEQHGRIIPFGDPENILGTRWLGFENQENARGFGIHGTSQPESIGKNMSSGCIRLRNEDVEILFEIVARGTPVEVM